jgi:release factor glutamine methyltransferase
MACLTPEVRTEPAAALYGGVDGLLFFRRIVEGLPDHLVPGGSLLLEVGDGQAKQVVKMLEGHFERISIERDYNQLDRVVIGDGYAG